MIERIKITRTYDESYCEDCGSSYEEAYIVDVNGKTYGNTAVACCFGGYGNDLLSVLTEALIDSGITVDYIDEEND